MSSPFPGMDPYLEDPVLWPDLHHGLIYGLKVDLNRVLPRSYVAHIDERLYVVNPRRNIYPDVSVVEHSRSRAKKSKGGTATAAIERDPPFLIHEEPGQIREAFINLVRRSEPGRVVATLEVLSPSNKDRGNPGHARYLQKQQQTLESTTHLVEIDLHRHGEHTIAASWVLLADYGSWDYVVCLHRAEEGKCFETWPFTLRQRLPRISVPLTDGDGDVVLDLQAVFERCYDECDYVGELDYTQDPIMPLREDDAAWADALLREKGLRRKRRRR